jgi:group I intron endonuclease
MPIVYCAQNVVNKKRYIGATIRTLPFRRREHLNDAKRPHRSYCRIFCKAIRKYGADSFEWSVLGEYPDGQSAYLAEIEFIKILKPEYNISTGGSLGTLGLVRTQEWKDNISKGLTGKPLSADHRKKAIDACARGRAKRHRPVVCLEDGKWFECARYAEMFYGLKCKSVMRVINGDQMKTKGLHFVESPRALSAQETKLAMKKNEDRRAAEKARVKAGFNLRAVRCLPDNLEFRSVTAAAAHYGLTAVTVHVKLKTGQPTVRKPKGLIFRYV